MDYIKQNHLSILIILFMVGSALLGGSKAPAQDIVGALDRTTVSNPWTFAGAVTMSNVASITGDVTLGGGAGALVITTTNAATSTASVGCVQTVATSTLTPIKLVIGSVNATASSTATNSTISGFVTWAYGTCP